MLIPPLSLIEEHSGGIDLQEFVTSGDTAVEDALKRRAGLLPSHRLLDIGCGCGKIARPLTGYLTGRGRYDGIDVTRTVIGWCSENYKPFPNFQFHHADIRSKRYNPRGTVSAATYIFPFSDDEFDIVFLGSVFTHMLPDEVDHYVREIARVLKPGGTCLATFFLLNSTSSGNVSAGLTTPNFAHRFGNVGCRIEVLDVPEAAIAYQEYIVREIYTRHRLSINAINYGEWGRGRFVPHWQDEVWSGKAVR